MGATNTQTVTAAKTAQASNQPPSWMANASLLAQAMSTSASAYVQASAISEQSKFQKQQLEANERLAEIQGKQAVKRGEREAQDIRKKTKQLIGSQRAALAAQGIEVNADTSADIQADTDSLGALDALTAKNNAWLEAWGYKVQANDYANQANIVRIAGKYNARQTLATGGLSAARDVAKGMADYKTGTKVKV